MTTIPTAGEAMHSESLKWLEIAISLNDGLRKLQKTIMDAELSEGKGIAHAVRLMTLAHAALTVAPNDFQFETWYRDKAKSLLLKAADVLAAVEAGNAPRSASLN
jgi:hypothetical protein